MKYTFNICCFYVLFILQTEVASRHFDSADAFIIIYSITDHESYLAAQQLLEQIRDQFKSFDRPSVLIGNKTDIADQRIVSRKDGRCLAWQFSSSFHELSAAKGYSHITNIFYELAKDVIRSRARTRKRKWLGFILKKLFLPKLCYSGSNTEY